MTELATTPDQRETDFLSRPLLSTMNLDWEKGIYLLLIALAIITRFWDLGSRVMSHDESLHTQFSYQFYNGDGYNHTPLMHGPFLFHITAVSYWLFGDSDLSARLPVAMFGVLLVVFPYLFRHWIGRVGALAASFLFLISPYVTYYSRYIRHDVYVIVWALIVFASIWFYVRQREEKYLWWFAAGLALMFSTKEVAFIYVAIFGSFLILRLLVLLAQAHWLSKVLPRLRLAILTFLVGFLLISGGLLGQQIVEEPAAASESSQATEGFAADPNEQLPLEEAAGADGNLGLLRWAQIVGIGVLSLGLFLAGREMRPHIDQHPEFDLIMLFTTLILPTVSPLLTTIAGWNPQDYTLSNCVLEGQETMTSLQILLAKLGNSICWSSFLSSGVVRSGMFLMLTLAVAILVGLWWHRRRWLTAAVIFHAIFAILYTSVLTNPGGWTSGMVGSLGYWLEQQAVERGSQPDYYYRFVMPLYEFLPLIFSLAAIRLWMRQEKINKILGYWLTLLLLSWLGFHLTNWLFYRTAVNVETSSTPGWILGLLVLGAGILYWFFARRRQLLAELEPAGSLWSQVDVSSLIGFVPSLIWWLVLTYVMYSYAGEKMPWLSIHFVIPMALLAGWYLNDRLTACDLSALVAKRSLQLWGLSIVLIIAILLALSPVLLGTIQLGGQSLDNLRGIGRFLGGLIIAGGLGYLWWLSYLKVSVPARRPLLLLSLFSLLGLLTVRFTYMANFPNADYTTEFLVYAHGAPATKKIVMQQVEELSMRLYGDKSIKVAFSQDTSWPFTWYLRDYPNRVFFGDNPSHSLTDSPVILVGSLDWSKTEPYLGDQYEQRTYTYLWWPMEEYRKFSWNAVFGNPLAEEPRGLGDPNVRQALWDIFFYRDYEKYGQVFGGNYSASQWPLRHEMRLYIRKDVLANLWDYGIEAIGAQARVDPYADKELFPSPILVVNESGAAGTAEGQLFAPRNVAIGPDDHIYVADSGNHRIQVFDSQGLFLNSWGGAGTEPGFFNEPWGIAVDDNFVYVADTWNHRIQKFTLDGDLAGVFGQSGSPADDQESSLGMFFGPRDIVDLGNNQLLVTDTGNHRLQVLDKDGDFIRTVGTFGNLLGQLNEPVGLAVGPDGTLLLTDTWNGRVQQFSSDVFAINEWPVDAWKGQSINNKPYLAADSAGRIYITDPEAYRVLIFSSFGDYLGRFGTFGTDVNSFGLPNGIAIDRQDNIYIVDSANNRVLKFGSLFGLPQEAPVEPVDEPIGQEGEGQIAPGVEANDGSLDDAATGSEAGGQNVLPGELNEED